MEVEVLGKKRWRGAGRSGLNPGRSRWPEAEKTRAAKLWPAGPATLPLCPPQGRTEMAPAERCVPRAHHQVRWPAPATPFRSAAFRRIFRLGATPTTRAPACEHAHARRGKTQGQQRNPSCVADPYGSGSMNFPQVSSLSSASDIVGLYRDFFLLPRAGDEVQSLPHQDPAHDTANVADVSDQGTVLIVPPVDHDAYRRWAASRTCAIKDVDTLMSRGQCPFALEATAALTNALVLDAAAFGPEDVRGSPSPSMRPEEVSSVSPEAPSASSHAFHTRHVGGDFGIRMAYAMSVVRFVNGVVDEFQKSMFATSIAVLAEHAGLPLWLVQIRHSAAHQTCPALNVLREAAIEVNYSPNLCLLSLCPECLPRLRMLIHFLFCAVASLAPQHVLAPNIPLQSNFPSGWPDVAST